MKYFELFDLDLRLDIDEKKLKEKFFILSRSVHPDFFTLSSVEEQMAAMEKSTLLNDAYKTLKDENSRIRYLLEEKGLLAGEEKTQMPMEFLMEMMDLNERIMESKMDEDKALKADLYEEIESLSSEWNSDIEELRNKGFAKWTDEDWEALKSFFLKQRYLHRLRQQLGGTSEM